MNSSNNNNRQQQQRSIREASHAGSWYTNDATKLDKQLSGWLEQVVAPDASLPPARAIISPHAGYSYSGPTAAFAFGNIDPKSIKRVFILGPSHHVYLQDCALSQQTHYATPIGDLPLDLQVIEELHQTGSFSYMGKEEDEDEHSIEMQLPYIRKVFQGCDIKVVPVMVGSLSNKAEAEFGRIMAPYLAHPENFFVISSDFCHWGKRFSYTFYDASKGDIDECIEWLDKEGMRIIETQDVQAFHAYRNQYKNTICGRHPIGVFLNALKSCSVKFDLSFVRYAQSSRCKTKQDSSVSYASAVLRESSASSS
ncbi:Cell motility mediator [Balamuthia mandrillaris]